ncbi:MAG: serine hydrolase [Betaproteobacteria bacterium]
MIKKIQHIPKNSGLAASLKIIQLTCFVLLMYFSISLGLGPQAFANTETKNTHKSASEKKVNQAKESSKKSISKKDVVPQTYVDKNGKPIRRPKNSREVRTTVLPRNSLSVQAPARISLGTAMGLKKHDELNLKSSVSIVIDQQTGDVLFEKNPTAVLPIASITKLVTAMTVLDAKQALDETLVIDSEDAAIYNHSRLAKGSELTRREAFLLALMSSENRAAYTLGRNYPGGMVAFIPAMNRKVRDLGLVNTHFEDPTGLTQKNVSSAEDLALIVNAAYQYPLIREFTTFPTYTKEINHRSHIFNNSNRLVRSGDMQIGLQKTGYISEAGRCLVMQALVNGKPVIMVFLDSATTMSRFADALRVRDWLQNNEADIKPIRKLTNFYGQLSATNP